MIKPVTSLASRFILHSSHIIIGWDYSLHEGLWLQMDYIFQYPAEYAVSFPKLPLFHILISCSFLLF